MRLCQILADHWPAIQSAYYQRDILKMPGHGLLNLVYTWAIERVQHDKLDEWLLELEDLLEWQDTEDSEAALNAESDSFMAFMAKGG